MTHQLALTIHLQEQHSLSDFYWAENILLRQLLDKAFSASPLPPEERLFYIWGATGSGKSHLLQGCCHGKESSIYLPLTSLRESSIDCLEGLEAQYLIAIDDVEAISTQTEWQEAIFHLYNKVREGGNTILLVSGKNPPQTLNLSLEDLRSRLTWGMVIHLKELPDPLKIEVLCTQAKKRGFILSKQVALFLLNHCERDMQYLYTVLNKLDHASLAAQRKITIPFVKSVLGV